MEYFDVITARRSVRKFSPEPVPTEVVERAIDAALLAPNSSNIQAWEFHWVKDSAKRAALVEACFGQNAAETATVLIVAVARVDTWRRHRDWLVDAMAKTGPLPKMVKDYYAKAVPLSYRQGPANLFGLAKSVIATGVGFFRPVPRGPNSRAALFTTVVKSAALACENLMLALTAQGYASCPMEGFDEVRVKKILGLNRHARIVMVIGAGRAAPNGVYGPQLRVPREWVVFTH
jgi:nitroreductase